MASVIIPLTLCFFDFQDGGQLFFDKQIYNSFFKKIG